MAPPTKTKIGKTSGGDSYHHGDLRRAMVTAALNILETQGIGALSLRAVAREAGVSQAAPYHHFENKEALLAAVAAEGFRSLSRTMHMAARRSTTPRERLHALGWGYVRFARRHPDLLRLMFGSGIADKSAYPDLMAAGQQAHGMLGKAVTQVLGSKTATAEVEVATAGAWALAHGLATLLVDLGIEKNLPPGVSEKDLVVGATAIFSAGLTDGRKPSRRKRKP